MSPQNTTHVTDTNVMSTPNATTVEVVPSANVTMDMWGTANIAKVRFVAEIFCVIVLAKYFVIGNTRYQ